jgi:hypothetical protein
LARIKSFKSSLIWFCLSVVIFVALGYLSIFLLLNLSWFNLGCCVCWLVGCVGLNPA